MFESLEREALEFFDTLHVRRNVDSDLVDDIN